MNADDFWAALPLGRGVTPLTRDANGLAAFAKPAGILSHPNARGEEPRSLLNAPYMAEGEYYEWGGARSPERAGSAGDVVQRVGDHALHRLWLLNRLDSATSGVILVASDAALAAAIKAHFKAKKVRKVYQALVFGKPRLPDDLWRDRFTVEKHAGLIRSKAGHIPAESRVTVVRYGSRQPVLTLIRLEPRTGRSHQLRNQCAKRSLPIVGDQTYGDFRRNREFAKQAGTKRLFLHSLETSFSYELGGRTYSFAANAPLPPEFELYL